MRLIGITQRVSVVAQIAERRDCLDQRWTAFLGACGLLPVPLPNDAHTAVTLCRQLPVAGLVLSGGNDLAAYGGDAPERDRTEGCLLDYAQQSGIPLLGVCRGMQVLQHRHAAPLVRIEGHVTPRQQITVAGKRRWVNSYHRFGTTQSAAGLIPWARADDGVIKALRHESAPLAGIMWHPEREPQPSDEDLFFFKEFFGVAA